MGALVSLWKLQDTFSRILIIGSLLLVIFSYLPTLQFDYATQDQWRAFRYPFGAASLDRLEACLKMIPEFYARTGRPLVWPTECLEHMFVSNISDFKSLRSISLVVVLLTVSYLSLVLTKFTDSLPTAFIIGAIFVTAPGYAFMYFQGWPALMVLVSVILATLSYQRFYERNNGEAKKITKIAISSILFMASCMIYASYAFLVVILALLCFATDTRSTFPKRVRDLIGSLLFYAALSSIYYILVKLCVAALNTTFGEWQLKNYEVTAQFSPDYLYTKLKSIAWMFYMMPPSNLHTPHGAGLIILLLFSLKASMVDGNKFQVNKIIVRFLFVFLISFTILMSSVSPLLFSKMDAIYTRYFLPFYLFFSFAAVWLVKAGIGSKIFNFPRLIPLLGAFSVLVSVALIQNRNSILEVVTTRVEIEALKAKLSQWKAKDWTENRFLLVVMPKVSRFSAVDPMVNWGEDNAVINSSRNPVGVPWMVNAVLLDIFQKSDLNTVDCAFDTGSCVAGALSSPHNIAIAYTYGTEPVKSAAQPYIINLSDITSQPITPDIVPQPGISASSVLENFNAEGLLYSTQPGWHAQKNPAYPQSITINFVMNKRIESIGFLPQDDNADRMPKHIKIETSENGSEWVTSGVYQDLCASKGADGWHQEKLPTPTEARYLRINIYSNCGNPNLLTLRGFRASP